LGIEITRTEVVQRTPRGWSGALADSYHTELQAAGTAHPRAVLSNPLIYHDPVEDGRRPGKMPPPAALVPWVGSKLGIPPGSERDQVAFLVARAIGRRGTTGQKMVADGWQAARRRIRPLVQKLGYDIVRDIR
jgi:hypothetical protein